MLNMVGCLDEIGLTLQKVILGEYWTWGLTNPITITPKLGWDYYYWIKKNEIRENGVYLRV